MDSDNESENYTPTWKGVPGSIILINVYGGGGESAPATVAHAATCRMVRQYLRSLASHNIAVCLYGTEDTNTTTSTLGTQSVINIFPLNPPTLSDFENLRKVNLSSYKPATEFKLSDVLWHCSKMFTNCKKQLSTRSVIMLTRLDVAPIESDQKPTLKRVVDLVDSNIDIKIINIAKTEYKVNSFYDEEFLIAANKGKDFVCPKPIWDEKEIEKVMHQQSHRHLAVAKLKFEVGNGVSIGVGVYNLTSRYIQHKKVNLERDTNTILSSVTKTMKVTTETGNNDLTPMDVDEDNGVKLVPLLRSEVKYSQEYGGRKVEFTDSEMKKLRNPFGPPMIQLLGFKPSSIMCKEKWFLKSGYFLFPNEGSIEGSTVAFKALHQACVETGMVGICVLCTRVNSRHTIVALSPCTHPLGLDVEIGFDVIQIPFVENVRDLPTAEENDEDIKEDQKKFIKNMLKTLNFDYKAEMFENPDLQAKYRAIEAKALEDDDFDAFVDTTKQDSKIFEIIQADLFEELFGPFGQVAPKRAATSRETGTSKKAKGEEVDESLVKDRIRCQTVNKFTVTQLKQILQSNGSSGIPALTGLMKNELVDLVYKYCS